MSISNIFIDVNCNQLLFKGNFRTFSCEASLLLNNCKVVSFCVFFSIELREQYIRTESYSWTFACQFSLRQKLSDDINVYE